MVLVFFWSNNGHVSNHIGEENVFSEILERENDFLDYKKRTLKSRKIDILPKRLIHCFSPEVAIFLTFFWGGGGNICHKKVFYEILDRKNDFLDYKNRMFKKSTNWHLSKGFWSKNGHFSNFFGGGNIGHENVFYETIERKNALQGFKKKKFKKSKNSHFFHRG